MNNLDDLRDWLHTLARPATLAELGALLASALIAWWLVRRLRRALDDQDADSIWFGRNVVDGVMFPAVLLALTFGARALVRLWTPTAVFRVAIPVLVALLVIRFGAKVLQAAFGDRRSVRVLERTISWLAWLLMVMWVSGLLPVMLQEAQDIRWTIGGTQLTLRALLEGCFNAFVVLLLALWVSAAIETRLLKSARGGELSLRKAISNLVRALLLFVGLMVALTAAGIDLTALSVFGGAIGVGIGFGLQKLASNYVSGFVMLAERSVRIGDSVRVDSFEGVITDINARCTMVRAANGRESIVPNEMFIVNRVENLSQADKRMQLTTVLKVAHDSDADAVMALLQEAALQDPRVLRDPAPSVALSNFAPEGLEFTVGYWVADGSKGTLEVRSAVNRAILGALRGAGVQMPRPALLPA